LARALYRWLSNSAALLPPARKPSVPPMAMVLDERSPIDCP